MKYAMIGTWKMAYDGIRIGERMLKAGENVDRAIEQAICEVEDNPEFVSVGYGGLPNSACQVELDAAYMHGDTLRFGGVMGLSNVRNPIKVALSLSKDRKSCLLCGSGAANYAQQNGFEFRNMLLDETKKRWAQACAESGGGGGLNSYTGHDTVCMIGLDAGGSMGVGVSTSGLFMKRPGRVGDSPIIGSGFYCDSTVGGATATGLGEDIMKGCLSYEIVRCMKGGMTPQMACERTLLSHLRRLESLGYDLDNIGVVALDREGNVGAASSLRSFAFVVADEKRPATVCIARNEGGTISVFPATAQDLADYAND